jgi:hypothetical protein
MGIFDRFLKPKKVEKPVEVAPKVSAPKAKAPEKTANTHYNEAQMDRRLKIYRDSNVHDSGQSVQDLFTRCFSKLNGEIPISENFKNINAFSASEPEIFGEL